jgi:centrosomal protein CEP95
MDREFRKKTEHEIETIQEQIFRDEDDEYFRQIDSDRLRHLLSLARYKAKV